MAKANKAVRISALRNQLFALKDFGKRGMSRELAIAAGRILAEIETQHPRPSFRHWCKSNLPVSASTAFDCIAIAQIADFCRTLPADHNVHQTAIKARAEIARRKVSAKSREAAGPSVVRSEAVCKRIKQCEAEGIPWNYASIAREFGVDRTTARRDAVKMTGLTMNHYVIAQDARCAKIKSRHLDRRGSWDQPEPSVPASNGRDQAVVAEVTKRPTTERMQLRGTVYPGPFHDKYAVGVLSMDDTSYALIVPKDQVHPDAPDLLPGPCWIDVVAYDKYTLASGRLITLPNTPYGCDDPHIYVNQDNLRPAESAAIVATFPHSLASLFEVWKRLPAPRVIACDTGNFKLLFESASYQVYLEFSDAEMDLITARTWDKRADGFWSQGELRVCRFDRPDDMARAFAMFKPFLDEPHAK